MAGTARAGSTSTVENYFDVLGPYIGNGSGSGIPWVQWTNGNGGLPDVHEAFPFPTAGGTRTAVAGHGTKPAPTEHDGVDFSDEVTLGDTWFEIVHLIPRTKIEFGNIITLIEESYEIFSAFRTQTVTLDAITNNVSPGVDLPNVTPTIDVGPLSSILDPTSTDNSAGTGLGTLVLTKVQATQDGLPAFDDTIVFDFGAPANDVTLELSGSRIVLIPFEYEVEGFQERLQFKTDIITKLSGKEQRIALRQNPRQLFNVPYHLDGSDRQRMAALLFEWTDKSFGFPLWHERLNITASTSAGATQYQVLGADDVDFRVGGLAVVIQDAVTFDVVTISAKTDTLITASDPAVNGYPAGTPIMPLRVAQVFGPVPTQREIVKLERFNVTIEVTDNFTGTLSGDSTPGFWSTYNSRVLFDDCNVVEGPMSGEIGRRIWRIDNGTGVPYSKSLWDKAKEESFKGFLCRDRSEILALRKLFIDLRGQQKAFYLPTFQEELTPVASLLSGSATIDVTSIGYPTYAKSREPYSLLHVEFTDGTSLVRTVSSAVNVDADTDRLTLGDTWPSTKTVDEVERIEFYDLVRFKADELLLRYRRIGSASARLPVIRVFDDD